MYGFRTGISSKNQETWDYGHKVCANTLLVYSIFSVIIYAICLIIIPFIFDREFYLRLAIGTVLALIGVAVTAAVVEKKTVVFGKTIADHEQ
jgi:hypothetical protein